YSGFGAMSKQMIWQLIASDCFNDTQYRRFRDGCERALRNANAALREAHLGIGTAHESNASRNRSNRPGCYDPELGIIKITEAASGAPLAAVLNFAIHGTVFGPSDLLYSADVLG